MLDYYKEKECTDCKIQVRTGKRSGDKQQLTPYKPLKKGVIIQRS